MITKDRINTTEKLVLLSILVIMFSGCLLPRHKTKGGAAYHSSYESAAPAPPPVMQLADAREFLVNGGPEGGDYHLFSYILFNSPVEPDAKAKHLSIIEAFLRLQTTSDYRNAAIPMSQINVLKLPIKHLPDPGSTNRDNSAQLELSDAQTVRIADKLNDANWLYDNYDFGTAKALLLRLNGTYPRTDGKTVTVLLNKSIYLVSLSSPITAPATNATPSPLVLIQDFSDVQPSVTYAWFDRYLQHTRTGCDIFCAAGFALNLRTEFAAAAASLPEVMAFAGNFLGLLKGEKEEKPAVGGAGKTE
jgi:hypothetical protein